MGADDLEARLRAAGVADTAAWSVGATIRPTLAASGATLAAPTAPTARDLPRLSVSLELVTPADAPAAGGSPGSDLEVRGLIGEGGMGRVLLARQHSLARDVAVKTAKEGAPAEVSEALLVEGAITGQLEHPAIVPVHALGLDADGRPAMVMKRVEGVSWDALARDASHAGWEGWDGDASDRLPGHLQILTQICNAVHFAHSRGVVHRDIKLENVLIGRFGDVYLADWGIATRVGEPSERLTGTPGYMAPEMVAGRPVDARTDVYLLGATLHEILTGEMRHGAASVLVSLGRAAASEPHEFGSDVPEELGALVNAACHREPSERPTSAMVFREALLAHARHRESAALARDGAARVERLAARLSARETDPEAGRAHDQLIAEARFALDTALRQWPDNGVAQRARARLDALLEARRARAAALEREARERDPRVESRGRALALSLFAALGVALTFVGLFGMSTISREQLVVFPFVVAALGAVSTFVLRRRLLSTRFNRQMVALLYILLGVVVLGRLSGYATEIDAATHFTRDCFVMTAGMAIGGVVFVRWLWVLAAQFLVGAALCLLWPDRALAVFSTVTGVALLTAALLQWRASARSRAD